MHELDMTELKTKYETDIKEVKGKQNITDYRLSELVESIRNANMEYVRRKEKNREDTLDK